METNNGSYIGLDPSTLNELASLVDRRYRDQIAATSARLRALADEVDRLGSDVRDHYYPDGTPPYGTAASQVFHAVMWGVAHLNLDALVRDASQADRFIPVESAE